MEKILVSACLMGRKCKYSGGSNYSREVENFINSRKDTLFAILVCPEVMGGLPTPRTPAEIRGELVVTRDGRDVTREYRSGAEKTAALAQSEACRYAILKERSPSCGSGQIYDGTFSHTVISGDGRTAGLLKKMGVRVYGETELEELAGELAEI